MIYFIRHGETDYNKQHRYQGHLDIPLNENGIMQAENARDELAGFVFDEIYSSPLSRARKTAEIINEKQGAELVFDDRLKEIYGGTSQGQCLDKWSEDEVKELHENPKKFGAESSQELCLRVEEFFKEIEDSDKNILIVAHGGVYRAIYRYINQLKEYHFELKGIKNATAVFLK